MPAVIVENDESQWKDETGEIYHFPRRGYEAFPGTGPENFTFHKNKGFVHVNESNAPRVLDHFKQWLPNANRAYEQSLRLEKQRAEVAERQKLQQEAARQESRANVLRNLKI
jgi:hypothetical protein